MSAPLPSMPPISAVRSPASPPLPAGLKDATAASQSTAPAKESYSALGPGGLKNTDNNHPMQSPTPPPKLPELVVSPNNSSTSSPTTTPGRAPAQLALLLSNALADVDALKGALADEKRRTSRAERLLQIFHPNDLSMNEQTSDGAMKAILDAEARADRAERERDDALHALHSLSNHFAELERYESSLSLRASDARSAFTRLLAGITASHPPPASSPILSGSPPALSLPTLPPPLPTPSLNSVPSQRLNTTVPPPSSLLSRYTRSLPQAAPTFPSSSYSHGTSHARQSSLTHGSTFSCLPLPPPPSASGLGSGLIGALPAPPSSSSSSFSVPAKRSHRTRSTRRLDDGLADAGVWEDSKRRRMGNWDMDVDEPNASHLEQPLPYPHHQPSLSAQPTQRVFEHDRDHLQHQQPYTRSSAPYPPRYEEQREVNGNGPASANGMVRLDARELVRDAKERERREKGYHPRHKDGETNRKSRRSASRSSWGSSRSIDEMLLETATDGERGRRDSGLPSPRGQQNFGNFPTQAHLQDAGTALPPLSGTREHKSERIGFHSSQPSSGSMSGVNGLVEKEKPVKVPATQLMTLGPGGVVVSGGGQAASAIPGGGFPPYNEAGQRICRQCGVPGRYKDGKCVEKWGPGPEGPGTVCDKCRKKMKRVERRGTLDGSVAAAQHQAFLAQRQSQPQLSSQGNAITMAPSHSSSHNQSRTSLRSDTLVVDPSGLEISSSSQSKNGRKSSWIAGEDRAEVNGKPRDWREKDERSRGGSRCSHSPALSYHSSSLRQSQGRDHGRVLTPPYITSISTREQDDENAEEEEEYGRDGNGELDVDAELAHAADVVDSRKSMSRTSVHYSSSSSLSLSSDGTRTGAPNGSNRPPRSASRGSSSSAATTDENSRSKKGLTNAPNGASNLRRIPLASDMTSPHIRRRDTQDELYEDDEDGDADADADADAEIMDAVNATMKIEE
ncbi:hypothetical protein ACEPAF_4284 [Sanghuangporus sanghuang]